MHVPSTQANDYKIVIVPNFYRALSRSGQPALQRHWFKNPTANAVLWLALYFRYVVTRRHFKHNEHCVKLSNDSEMMHHNAFQLGLLVEKRIAIPLALALIGRRQNMES